MQVIRNISTYGQVGKATDYDGARNAVWSGYFYQTEMADIRTAIIVKIAPATERRFFGRS